MKTRTTFRIYFLLTLLASLLLLSSPIAQAETVNCTNITSVPYTINGTGIYCLKFSRFPTITSGAAITINSNHVVLDLNGFILKGVPATPGAQTVGISASQRSNITIKNGTIRGFTTGISLAEFPGLSSGAHLIENMVIDQVNSGITARGDNITVRNNHIIGARTTGIRVDGHAPAAIGNVVDGSATGITFSEGLAFSTAGLAQGNRITNSNVGIDVTGLGGKYLDNLTINVATPYVTGSYPSIDAGNNN